MDQFILFGDSITQQCFTTDNGHGFFGPALSNVYVRRLDVINRGFSGYNTLQALRVLPNFMPSPEQARVRFMLVFFGANDARLPNTPGGPDQHIPLEQYQQNLRCIATHPCIHAHQSIKLILVTPPPVDERKLMEADRAKYPGLGDAPRRTAATTAQYAQAVRDLGKELKLPVLDVWSAMMRRAEPTNSSLTGEQLPGSKDAPMNEELRKFLHDGLHFTRSAYEVLYQELMELVEKVWPDQMPDSLPFALPAWDDEQAWKNDNMQDIARNML